MTIPSARLFNSALLLAHHRRMRCLEDSLSARLKPVEFPAIALFEENNATLVPIGKDDLRLDVPPTHVSGLFDGRLPFLQGTDGLFQAIKEALLILRQVFLQRGVEVPLFSPNRH